MCIGYVYLYIIYSGNLGIKVFCVNIEDFKEREYEGINKISIYKESVKKILNVIFFLLVWYFEMLVNFFWLVIWYY